MITPYYQDNQTTLLNGDCLTVLRALPDESVQCCVTSPPYFGLRDYGVDGQIGLEQSPDAYVAKLVEVFREVRRVLRDDGVLWLNLGDSYAMSTIGSSGKGKNATNKGTLISDRRWRIADGLKPKDLIGIPWRVAFALQADGWWLRQDIIWAKSNPMPESVRDRCTKAHEYIFLMSKSAKYFYDADAVREPLQASSIKRNQTGWNGDEYRGYVNGPQNHMSMYLGSDAAKAATHRNRRSVWTVSTKPYSGAHFAVFPPDLIEPCILAGSREGDTVLDPFGGSGTTAAVAKKHGRNAILVELNPQYCDLAIERIKATKEKQPEEMPLLLAAMGGAD